MYARDDQYADAAMREADLCESGAQPPSCSASWSSEESRRENGLPDLLDGVTGQRIRVRRPRAKANNAAQPEYNPDYQAPDGSAALTNVNFYEPGDRQSRLVVTRSRASHADVREDIDDRPSPNSTCQQHCPATALEPSRPYGPPVDYDGTSLREDAGQPPLQADCSTEDGQVRMRQLANVFIELFNASRQSERMAPTPSERAS
jgi:hypothetical protein